MHLIHDVDALLLLATALASKRRPAELAAIIAAADLIQGFVPFEAKLRDAFSRLAVLGLIVASDDGFALTPDGQALMLGQPRKADNPERLAWMNEKLAAYIAKGEQPAIVLTSEQVIAAIAAHRTSAKGAGKNMLMPKPKPVDGAQKRPGQWRKPNGPRRRT